MLHRSHVQALLTTLTVLALVAPLVTSPARACVFGPFQLYPAASYPAQTDVTPTCAPQPLGRDPDCLLHKRDLAQASGALGTMAAGGMGLPGGILRALAGQVQRAGGAFGGL